MVNFSSQPTPGSTAPPEIDAREHRSLPDPSYVRCEYARITPAATIEQGLTPDWRNNKVLSGTKSASPGLVKKLQEILGASPNTPNEVKDLLRAQGYISA